VIAFGIIAFLGWQGRELPHRGGKAAYDQHYMRRMAAHHAQGIELAQLAAERAQDPHLRALVRLMAATQKGEIAVFDQWWRSWFGDALPPASPEDHATMPGMLSMEQIEGLKRAEGVGFDPLFVRLMSIHHEGAIAMAQEALRDAGDLRLKLMSHAIRHEQRGEIALMHGTEGLPAVKAAVSALVRPAGQSRSERGTHDPPDHHP
jgi:uncharacterized protein (DUF305 family)